MHALNAAAFGRSAEADLVDALRREARPMISLVAEDSNAAGAPGGLILGHIMFSPVTLDTQPQRRIMGLAPMAVLPGHQRKGVGAALVRAGLENCRQLSAGAVVVLGHPEYYPRFGFRPASTWDIRSEYKVPDEAFMAIELIPGFLADITGTVRYHAMFGSF